MSTVIYRGRRDDVQCLVAMLRWMVLVLWFGLELGMGFGSWTEVDPDRDVFDNELLDGRWFQNGLEKNPSEEHIAEGRELFKKALLPMLIGITLKASSLIPVKLMVMAFVAIMSLVFAKLGLALSLLLGFLQFQQAHKKTVSMPADRWFVPSTTRPTPVVQTTESEEEPSGSYSVQQEVTSTPETKTKRVQMHQYDPFRYEPFRNDPFNNEVYGGIHGFYSNPYRYTGYDFPS